MKLAILTDLHANREALSAVLAHAAAQRVDGHALLGDFVGYGADPGWVVDRVRELAAGGAIVVQGNHDEAVVRGAAPSMRALPRQVLEWTRTRLDGEQLRFLANLPLAEEHDGVLYVHANAWAPAGWGYVLGRGDALRSLQATRAAVTFCGHVHEPHLYHLAPTGKTGEFTPLPGVPIALLPTRRWLAIPGSAGQPRDGDPAACYACYDTSMRELVYWRVAYDHETSAAKVRAAGLPALLAERLVDGT
jgi:diadenosine tetraphosphatase ApaH/serine/threonine PP2A family protein phosphatase